MWVRVVSSGNKKVREDVNNVKEVKCLVYNDKLDVVENEMGKEKSLKVFKLLGRWCIFESGINLRRKIISLVLFLLRCKCLMFVFIVYLSLVFFEGYVKF